MVPAQSLTLRVFDMIVHALPLRTDPPDQYLGVGFELANAHARAEALSPAPEVPDVTPAEQETLDQVLGEMRAANGGELPVLNFTDSVNEFWLGWEQHDLGARNTPRLRRIMAYDMMDSMGILPAHPSMSVRVPFSVVQNP